MKQIPLFFIFLTGLFTSVHAQVPEKMSYQAVIRNSADELVKNTQIGMRISILQGSETGTEVYTETQTPTTNANGLVSIQFGGGVGFSEIDWSSGVFFLKTETDISGGTNYTITGTSQLLSVPFALYAKKSGMATQPPTCSITNPVDNSKIAVGENIMVEVAANDADGDFVEVQLFIDGFSRGTTITSPYIFSISDLPLGNHTIIALARDNTGAATKSETVNITIAPLAVGVYYQGGVIAYIDGTGQHGLIAAPSDQIDRIMWYNGSYTVTGATATAIGTGQSNTTAIVTTYGDGVYAAKMCDELVLGGYDDWFLPSKDELNELFINRDLIGGFVTNPGTYYWSSTERNYGTAYSQNFNNGSQSGYDQKNNNYHMRAVRAF